MEKVIVTMEELVRVLRLAWMQTTPIQYNSAFGEQSENVHSSEVVPQSTLSAEVVIESAPDVRMIEIVQAPGVRMIEVVPEITKVLIVDESSEPVVSMIEHEVVHPLDESSSDESYSNDLSERWLRPWTPLAVQELDESDRSDSYYGDYEGNPYWFGSVYGDDDESYVWTDLDTTTDEGYVPDDNDQDTDLDEDSDIEYEDV